MTIKKFTAFSALCIMMWISSLLDFLVPDFASRVWVGQTPRPSYAPDALRTFVNPIMDVIHLVIPWALNASQWSDLPSQRRKSSQGHSQCLWLMLSCRLSQEAKVCLVGSPALGGALWYPVLKHWIWGEEVLISGLPLSVVCVLLHGPLSWECWGRRLDKADGWQGGICRLVSCLGARSHQRTHRAHQIPRSRWKVKFESWHQKFWLWESS